MKHFYFACAIEENGKFSAFVLQSTTGNNLKVKFDIPGLIHANICETRKRAIEIANYWNSCYKRNGTYLYDNKQ